MRTYKVLLSVGMSFDQAFGIRGDVRSEPTDTMADAEKVAAVQVLTALGGWTDMENAYPENVTLTPAMIAKARRHPDGDSGLDCIVYVVDAEVCKVVTVKALDEAQAIDIAEIQARNAARSDEGSTGWFFADAPELAPIIIFADTASGIVGAITDTDPQDDIVTIRVTRDQAEAIRSAVCKAAPLSKRNPNNSRTLNSAIDRALGR